MRSYIPTKQIMANSLCLLTSIALNIILLATGPYLGSHHDCTKQKLQLSWTQEAAAEAEATAAISCSGNGRAYLDSSVDVYQQPICECNTCYSGPDCSVFLPDCAVNAESGDSLFLEPFWVKHAAKSAVLISGWHRMSYTFGEQQYGSISTEQYNYISPELEIHIRKVHALAKNAITKGKYIVFGVGSTQLLSAAIYALSMNLSSPASVVAANPSYPVFKLQTDFFQNTHFEYKGDTIILLNNSSYNTTNFIEFVTSPNNPDGNLRNASVSHGSSIHDHVYYWPHFTAIPAPADEDVMIFTLSKLTGHAGSRFGWAIVKDEGVYQRMSRYIFLAEMGVSRETQLRALKLVKTILDQGNGTELFEFGFHTMRDRWERLSQIISLSKRFTLQEIPPQVCSFFEKVRGPSPAYAWLRCEREEDSDCKAVLRAANIQSRAGKIFNVENRYTRLSLLMDEHGFNLLLLRLTRLIQTEEHSSL